ncbi:MAG: HDIG domain-containing protein [Nitrospirae bacterium]|nr:HDIG domain-containing protein [Nitrospirota bacterium]
MPTKMRNFWRSFVAKLGSLKREWILKWLSTAVFYILLVGIMMPGMGGRGRTWKVGDIPEADVRAPYNFLVFNKEKTEEKRRQAEEEVKPVYVLDDGLAEKLNRKITLLFAEIGGAKEKEESSLSLSPFSLRILESKKKAEKAEKTSREIVKFLLDRGIFPEGARFPGTEKVVIKPSGSGKEREEDAKRIIKWDSLKDIVERKTKEMLPGDRLLGMAVREIVENVIEPNLKLDEEKTNKRKEKARNAVVLEYNRIEKGERILTGGVKVTAADVKKLQALLSSSDPRRVLSTAGGLSILTLIFFFIVGIYLRKYQSVVLTDLHILFLLGLIVIGVILIAKIIIGYGLSGYLIPVAIAPMLIAILVEPRLAVVVAVVLSIFIGVLTGYRLDYMVIALAGGMVGLFSVAKVRKRSDLIKAGFLVSLVNVTAILGFRLLDPLTHEPIIRELISGAGNGIISAVVSLGILPILEPLFKITTDIKLLELLDINQPILKRVKNEAPGTYQSSLVVANLAESAAQDVGANALLAKVGSYYHDIGKINKASYFIENQKLAQDKHEKLNPTMSSLILISHVKEGVELARKNKLPEVIIDIVRQHHGTTLASFFYQQAVEEDERQKVNKDTFRYPGPKPQTREAAIVMLADSVEAASRTLSEPTPGRIKNLVKKVINNKFIDYQLDESNLALSDLHQISETFTQILISMFHTRIEYPDEELNERGREIGEDKKSAKKNKSRSKNNQKGRGRNAKKRR